MSKDKSQPRVKKSETLEVRIPYETKQAFLTACREDGTTASEVVRDSVQTYLDQRERPDPKKERTLVVKLPQPVRRYGLRAAAGGLAAVGLTTFAALPVAAAPDFASIFKSMDANGDGVLTAQEFARTGGKDGDQKSVERQVTTKTITIDRDDAPAAAPAKGTTEIKQDAFAFWLPDDDSSVSTQQVNSVQHREVRIVTDSHDADAIATPPSLEDIRADEFKAFDTDKDGKVSLAEFQARHRAMLTRGFEILDANKDKYLSAMEYAQMSNPPLPHLGGDPPIPAVPVPPGDKPMMTPEKLQASFTRLDTNKDSRLSLQEYLPPA